jgi:histidinol-phosphate aminotransferase
MPSRATARLHLNEFRFEHAPGVLRTLASVAADPATCTLYASAPTLALREALLGYLGLVQAAREGTADVAVGAGSDEILRAVVDACALRGITRVFGGEPTYTHFSHFVRLRGLRWVPLNLGLSPSFEDLTALLGLHASELDKGALVYLCTPNNPTGHKWELAELAELARRWPAALFLFDEAYIEFEGAAQDMLAAPSTPEQAHACLNASSSVSLLRPPAALGNVVIARTFSKAFGLAGLRLGYCAASVGLVGEISVALSPKSVTALADAGARAALAEAEHYLSCAQLVAIERMRVVSSLKQLGIPVGGAGGNFVLFALPPAGVAALREQSAPVYVRERGMLPGLQGFARVTIGAGPDTDVFIRGLRALGSAALAHPGAQIQSAFTPKKLIAAIRALLSATLDLLREKKVEAWLDAGTLLGAVRHGGLLPWDDDGDVGYLVPAGGDPLADAGVRDAFRARGITLQRNRTDAYWQVGTQEPGARLSPAHIDLFPYRWDPEAGFYLNADPRFRYEAAADNANADCNPRYGKDELFPLASLPFYGEERPVPARYGAVLDRALGVGWRTEAVIRVGGRDSGLALIRERLTEFAPA